MTRASVPGNTEKSDGRQDEKGLRGVPDKTACRTSKGRAKDEQRAWEVQGKRPIDDVEETPVELKCAVVSSMASACFGSTSTES